MKFLCWLEQIRNPFLDFFFSAITYVGDEIVFLAISIFIFWCVDKREGYYILITGLVGTLANQALKLTFRTPRPWVREPSFNAIASAKPAAEGFSFPSGHTQNVTGTFASIAFWTSKKVIFIISVIVILLVSFSRLYLGVHMPEDVLFSLGFEGLLALSLYPLFSNEKRFNKLMPYITVVATLLSVGYLVYAFIATAENIEPTEAYSARKNAVTLFGCTLGLIPVYFVDKRFIKFQTDARWYAQIIKLVVGFGVVMGVKILGGALFGKNLIARAVIYFTIVIFAGILWPMTFKFFSKLEIPRLNKLFKKKQNNQ